MTDANTTQELDRDEIMAALREHHALMESLRDEISALRSDITGREAKWRDVLRQTVYYMLGLLGIK